VKAVAETGRDCVAVSGGVSCNTRLRERFEAECSVLGIEVRFAEPRLCTDNAGMIGFVGALKLARGEVSLVTTDIDPNLRLV
jgi:N6-L-threonylcarbamoyladenine synthase